MRRCFGRKIKEACIKNDVHRVAQQTEISLHPQHSPNPTGKYIGEFNKKRSNKNKANPLKNI